MVKSYHKCGHIKERCKAPTPQGGAGVCAAPSRADPALRGQRYCGAARTRTAGRAAGPECGPCATATYQIHGHGEMPMRCKEVVRVRREESRGLGQMRQCLFDLFFRILVIGEFACQVFLVSRHIEVAVAA